MPSKSLQHKVKAIRERAHLEVHQLRLCAGVIHALVSGKSVDAPVTELKAALGSNWSSLLAIQYLSGRRAEAAVDAAPENERHALFLAHLIAKEICSEHGLGSVAGATVEDIERLRVLASKRYGQSQVVNQTIDACPLIAQSK